MKVKQEQNTAIPADATADALKATPKTRQCAVCEREVEVVCRRGPLLIKAPCGNKCGVGYVGP